MTIIMASLEELKPEDVVCSICLEIMIEPITMPCNHRLCKVRYMCWGPTERYLDTEFLPNCLNNNCLLINYFQPCYQQNIEVTSLQCPYCKRRIGTWNRQAKDKEKCKKLNIKHKKLVSSMIHFSHLCAR